MLKLKPALFFCAVLLLAACAAKPPASAPAAPPEVRNATPQGNLIRGTLMAIRPVTSQTALSPSSAQVLAALQTTAPAQNPNATEFVIKRNDGNIAAVVLASPATAPGASLSAADFTVGEQVELLTGARTELLHAP